jgi:RimJ/RimL family protein N-acetyltransferase
MDILEITYKEELTLWETYPPMPQAVKLLDGTIVTVRPIRSDDAPRLQALFARLSPDSIYRRFLGYRRELPYEQAVRLATVDYRTQMALVATREGEEREQVVAVARYAVTNPDQPDRAEVAVVTEDRCQGRGLGLLLLKWLMVYAQTHDIRVFQATVHPHNTQILRFIERSKLPVQKKLEAGAWEIQIRLEPEPDHRPPS